jgi:hypothetical protein
VGLSRWDPLFPYLLTLDPHLQAVDMENVRARQFLARRRVHFFAANDARAVRALELFLCGVWEPLVQIGRDFAVPKVRRDAALEVLDRHPQVTHNVERHAIVRENERKKHL